MLDDWLADPGASFLAAEEEGQVVGVQRLRPIAPGVMFYEGLRVAADQRRRGVGRVMLRHAIATARGLAFTRLRLVTGNPHAAALFASEGFRPLCRFEIWRAPRTEAGEPARLAAPTEAAALAGWLRRDPALAAYGGVNPDWNGVLDVDEALIERLAGRGLVRAGPAGRALALVRADARNHLPVTLVAGPSGALSDLLAGLRAEADARDLEGVAVLVPPGHPAADDLPESGYAAAPEQGHGGCFSLDL